MNAKPTISVGIPAYNEEANIKNLLDLILSQRRDNFELEKIIVVCDGCTDSTEKIVEEFAKNNLTVNLYSDGKRIGKAERLNQLYRMNESDCLITLDADIEPENEFVLEKLIEPLKESQTAVVAGNARPLPGRTLVERLIVAKDSWWYEARKNFKAGNNIYNSAGCCFALKKSFAKNCNFLPKTVNDQEIIFLEAKRQGKIFVFSEEASFFYREASTLSELISRMRRFERQDNLGPYGFGVDINAEYKLPFGNKILGLLKVIYKNPFYGIGSLFLASALKFIPREKSDSDKNNPAIWEITASTKTLHNYETYDVCDYSCEVINKLEEKHKSEWLELWKKSKEKHFFNSPNFFQACREAFNIETYAIIFCYRNGALCGVLPLTEGKTFGVRALIAPGNSLNYIDKSPILADEYSENLINAILSSALRLGNLYLAELNESLKPLARSQHFKNFITQASESPKIFLSEDTDVLRYMSGDQRRNLNRLLRQQKELISFRVEGVEALEKVISVEKGSYRPHCNMAFFKDESSIRFLAAIEKFISGGLLIGILYAKNQPIATNLGFSNEKIFYGYHTAFLEQYRRIGPGKMALYFTLEHLKKKGFKEIDLLRGNSEIKRQFSGEIRVQYDAYLSKSRLVIVWWKLNFLIWKTLKQINSQARKTFLRIKRYRRSFL